MSAAVKRQTIADRPPLRRRLWAAIRSLARGGARLGPADRGFSVAKIAAAAPAAQKDARRFVVALLAAGVLQTADDGLIYLERDVGETPPVLAPDGSLSPPRRPLHERLWLAMAPLGKFTPRELAAVCDNASASKVKIYIRALYVGGYLERLSPAVTACRVAARRQAVYALRASHNSGPMPPRPVGGGIYDPNVGRLILPGERP
jgi:hypothetical protein